MGTLRKKSKIQYFLLMLFVPSAIILAVNLFFQREVQYCGGYSIYSWQFLIFPILAFIASFWFIRTSGYGVIHLISPIIYGCLLMYSSVGAISALFFALALSISLFGFMKKSERLPALKSFLILLLSLSVSCVFYRLFISVPFSIRSDSFFFQLIILAGAVVIYALLSSFLHTLDNVLFSGFDPQYLRKINLKTPAVYLLTVYPLGILACITASLDMRALLLLTPVYIMYASLKNYSEISKEAKTAIEEIIFLYEQKNPQSVRHSAKVSILAAKISRKMILDDVEIDKIAFAARLHDIGMIGLNDDIAAKYKNRNKTGELTALKKSYSSGVKILKKLSWFKEESAIIGAFHERFDGSGFPLSLKGENIPRGARILSLAHEYEYLLEKTGDSKLVMEHILNEAYNKFDPEAISALQKCIEK